MGVERLAAVWPEWKILEKIGEGSFGKVYKAVHEEHTMKVYSAIKVISVPQNDAELSSLRAEGLDETASKTYFQGIVNDFVNEIKLMESMKGTSNIVSVEDFKVLEKEDVIGWDIFIRMELLTPFNDYLATHELTEDDVIRLGIDVCSALELCAKKSVIHRDIKPENIFISAFDDFKVGDFGIAKELEKTTGALSSKGTYNYMAPEIAMGKKYDATVDIYSLGVVLYRLLNNNRLPFIDPYSQQITYQQRKEATDRRLSGKPLPPPVKASAEMAEVILTACSYDPAKRFGNPTALKTALYQVRGSRFRNPAPPPAMKKPDLDSTVALRRAPQQSKQTTVRVQPKPIPVDQKFKPTAVTPLPKKEKKSRPEKRWLSILLAVLLFVSTILSLLVFEVRNALSEENIAKILDDIDLVSVMGSYEKEGQDLTAFYNFMERDFGVKMDDDDLESFLNKSSVKDFLVEKISQVPDAVLGGDGVVSISREEVKSILKDDADAVVDHFNLYLNHTDRQLIADWLLDSEEVKFVNMDWLQEEMPFVSFFLSVGLSYITAAVFALIAIALLVLMVYNSISHTLLDAGTVFAVVGAVTGAVAVLAGWLPEVWGSMGGNTIVGAVIGGVFAVNGHWNGLVFAMGVAALVLGIMLSKKAKEKGLSQDE